MPKALAWVLRSRIPHGFFIMLQMASPLTGTPAVIQIAPFLGTDDFHTHGFLHLSYRHGALLHDCVLFLGHTHLTFLCVGKWHS